MMPATPKQIFSDTHFMAAILAAIVFWLSLYIWQHPDPQSGWPVYRWQMALQVVLLYPILEEYVFRGLVQGYLLKLDWGRRRIVMISVANIVSSIIFMGLHFIYHPPLAAAGVFLPSLIFGYFRERHQRLLSPILLHGYYNLGYFWLFS